MTVQDEQIVEQDYLIAPEAMVIDFIGWGQVTMPEGISLNRLQAMLQIWVAPMRVMWYRLKDLLLEMEKRGVVVQGRSPHRKGRVSWSTWLLADHETWMANTGLTYELERNSELVARRAEERALKRLGDEETARVVAAEEDENPRRRRHRLG
jgi:hypothetical protein